MSPVPQGTEGPLTDLLRSSKDCYRAGSVCSGQPFSPGHGDLTLGSWRAGKSHEGIFGQVTHVE